MQRACSFVCWIGILGSVIGGFVMIACEMGLAGILTIILGTLISWIGSWALYAIGESADQAEETRKEIKLLKAELAGIRNNAAPETKEENAGFAKAENTPREVIQQIREKYEDPNWEKLERGYVRCPQCGRRLSVDFLEARKKCPDCGREYKAAKILKS